MIRLGRWLRGAWAGQGAVLPRVPESLRVFLLAWAAGFVFFLVFLG